MVAVSVPLSMGSSRVLVLFDPPGHIFALALLRKLQGLYPGCTEILPLVNRKATSNDPNAYPKTKSLPSVEFRYR